MKVFRIFRILCIAAVAGMALCIAGCSDTEKSNTSTQQEQVQPQQKKTEPKEVTENIDIMVYYADENATGLIGEKRTLAVKQGDNKYQLAVEELLKKPNTKGLVEVFPQNAKVKSVKVENGTATVDFNRALKTEFKGGSTGEELLVDSLVNTLTDFSEIKKVKILIEGKEIESLAGHMDLSTAQKRRN